MMKRIFIHIVATLLLLTSFHTTAFADQQFVPASATGFDYQTDIEFDLGSFGPGDKFTQTVETKNVTKMQIDYQITGANNLIDDHMLFNEIDLTIQDDETIYYSGKISDAYFDPIQIDPGTSHYLTYTFELSKQVKNEFQGSELYCELVFYAKAERNKPEKEIITGGYSGIEPEKKPVVNPDKPTEQYPESIVKPEPVPTPDIKDPDKTITILPPTGDNSDLIVDAFVASLVLLIICIIYDYKKYKKGKVK